MVNLELYDCIGFDLDNTLVEYNVPELSELTNKILSSYLVSQKGYAAEHLTKSFASGSKLVQKGLALDLEKGNIVKIGPHGEVLKACHGTLPLTAEQVRNSYGDQGIWKEAKEYTQNPFAAWNGPLGDKIRCLLDYFDMPSALIFARAVETVDAGIENPVYRNVWLDILDGLNYMYQINGFKENVGDYFPTIKASPAKYIKNCSAEVLNWLDNLKKTGKLLFLITGSAADYASFIASTAIGSSWEQLFDIIVFYAKKPAFFSEVRPFLSLDGNEESHPVKLTEDTHKVSRGNWKELNEYFVQKTKKLSPSSIYIGDNLIQDILAPVAFKSCNALAICKEMQPLQRSDFWGSYFNDEKHGLTFWGSLIGKTASFHSEDLLSLCKNCGR